MVWAPASKNGRGKERCARWTSPDEELRAFASIRQANDGSVEEYVCLEILTNEYFDAYDFTGDAILDETRIKIKDGAGEGKIMTGAAPTSLTINGELWQYQE